MWHKKKWLKSDRISIWFLRGTATFVNFLLLLVVEIGDSFGVTIHPHNRLRFIQCIPLKVVILLITNHMPCGLEYIWLDKERMSVLQETTNHCMPSCAASLIIAQLCCLTSLTLLLKSQSHFKYVFVKRMWSNGKHCNRNKYTCREDC